MGGPVSRAGRARRRAVRLPFREPRRGGRRHAASSPRTDLCLPVRAPGRGARASPAARTLGGHGARPAGGAARRRARLRCAPALRRRRRGGPRARVRPLPVRSVDRFRTPASFPRGPRRRRARGLCARAQDGPAEIRRLVAATDAVRAGRAPGPDRRRRAPGGARARGNLSGLPHAGAAQVPRGQRSGRGRVHGGHAAGRESGRAARHRHRVVTFEAFFGRAPAVIATAPGRVNLIGEHTDYNGGFVLPIAIAQRTTVHLAPRADPLARVWSAYARADGILTYCVGDERRGGGWLDYVQGVTHALAGAGRTVGGFEARIDSTVPAGSGLSSSAALEIAL